MAVKKVAKKTTKKAKAATKKTVKKTTKIKSSSTKPKPVQTKVQPVKGSNPATIGDAIAFPFRKWYRCFNIFWILLPVLGWAAIGGYLWRIVNGLLKNELTELPKFNFAEDMKNGWLPLGYIILYSLAVNILLTIIGSITKVGMQLTNIYISLIAPMLVIQFFESRSIQEGFNIGKATKLVFRNFGDYIITLLKQVVVIIVFLLALLLFFLGYGAMVFGGYYLMIDFYKRNVNKL